MPGNVQNASVGVPPRVLPAAFSTAFTEAREYTGRINEYPDGRSQRVADVTNSRKAFERSLSLDPAAMAAMESFLEANIGLAHYFYFFAEGAHDPSGVATDGRYKVRIENWSDSERGMGRGSTNFRLIEVA